METGNYVDTLIELNGVPGLAEPHTSTSAPAICQASATNENAGHRMPTEQPCGLENTNVNSGQIRNVDSKSDISYLFLTFKTALPSPNITRMSASTPSPHPTNTTPPEQPDLAPFADPTTWPASRKYLMLALSCFATFLTAYTAGSYSPTQDLMREDLGAPSNVAVLAGITTFCGGFALAPMILAPFSEMNGRYPVFVAAGTLFVIFQAVCGVVPNLVGMLFARLIVGIGASVFSTMVGGIIADMWDKEGRNTPMALFSGAVLIGTGAGPLAAAIITQRLGNQGTGNAAAWKWVFWHQVIAGVVCMVALVFFFKESRGSVLLSRKAKALNRWYEELEAHGYYGVSILEDKSLASPDTTASEGSLDEEKGSLREISRQSTAPNPNLRRIRWLAKDDEERSSLGKMISVSVYRPFHLLCTESVVFFFSLWVSFAWGVLYLTFGSIPLVFRQQYGWNIEQAGYIFGAMMIGATLATAMSIWQEQLLSHPQWQPRAADSPCVSASSTTSSSTLPLPQTAPTANHPHPKPPSARRSDLIWAFIRRRFPASAPEARLYFTCVTSILLPAGLFLFGFAARPDIHWIAPAIGIALSTMGILSIYLAVFNYFADTYHRYASSALAAQSFCRNIVGGAFPLVTGALFNNLGAARATGMLGAIAVGLTVVPWVLVFYGERIRARSPFAIQLGND